MAPCGVDAPSPRLRWHWRRIHYIFFVFRAGEGPGARVRSIHARRKAVRKAGRGVTHVVPGTSEFA